MPWEITFFILQMVLICPPIVRAFDYVIFTPNDPANRAVANMIKYFVRNLEL